MRRISYRFQGISLAFFMLVFFVCCQTGQVEEKAGNFKIGWATIDITPDKPVLMSGYFNARVSEGIMDPLTVTALAMESGSGPTSEKVIMISCDLSTIRDGSRDGSPDNLRDNVRKLLVGSLPELSHEQIILNASHTHVGPFYDSAYERDSKSAYGVELEVMEPWEYQEFLTSRIVDAAIQAWNSRKPGGVSYGLGHAVVGHIRLRVDLSGRSEMYGSINNPEFSHIDGFEDHSVHLLYTWDPAGSLTGVVVNIACPSQAQGGYELSADFWHDTREEIRRRLGDDIFIFAQNSSSGDKSPRVMVDTRAEERMERLMFPGTETGSERRRKMIALRISNAVTSVLPHVKDSIQWDPVFAHRMETAGISRRLISEDDVRDALEESEPWRKQYEQMLLELEKDPSMKDKPRWYVDITRSYRRMLRGPRVGERFELQKRQPEMTTEVHVIRIGDIVVATHQYELYLDYGIRIKGRSPALQTFLVQLAGWGTYLPTTRAIAGGGYGSQPQGTMIGPEGGQELVEKTLEMINSLWEKI